MNTKHFVLSTISTLSLAAISTIHAVGLLSDTSTPVHLLIESNTAKNLDLLPVAQKPKTFKPSVLADIIDNTQAVGIKFVAMPDLKQRLDSSLIGKLQSTMKPDTAMYIGPMPAMTGDDDIGDDNLVVMAVGPQAKSLIETFSDLGEYKAMESAEVKQFFTALVTPKHTATKSGKSVGQPLKQLAAA